MPDRLDVCARGGSDLRVGLRAADVSEPVDDEPVPRGSLHKATGGFDRVDHDVDVEAGGQEGGVDQGEGEWVGGGQSDGAHCVDCC